MAVAEALAAGLPAIVSKGAPWQGLESHGAGWWIDISVENLVTTLREALSKPRGDLEAMGMRGREWMERDFSWALIAQRWTRTYRWLLDKREPRPEWVRTR